MNAACWTKLNTFQAKVVEMSLAKSSQIKHCYFCESCLTAGAVPLFKQSRNKQALKNYNAAAVCVTKLAPLNSKMVVEVGKLKREISDYSNDPSTEFAQELWQLETADRRVHQ